MGFVPIALESLPFFLRVYVDWVWGFRVKGVKLFYGGYEKTFMTLGHLRVWHIEVMQCSQRQQYDKLTDRGLLRVWTVRGAPGVIRTVGISQRNGSFITQSLHMGSACTDVCVYWPGFTLLSGRGVVMHAELEKSIGFFNLQHLPQGLCYAGVRYGAGTAVEEGSLANMRELSARKSVHQKTGFRQMRAAYKRLTKVNASVYVGLFRV